MYIPIPTLRGKILIGLTIGAFAVAMVNANPATALITAIFISMLLSSFVFSFSAVSGLSLSREPCRDGEMGALVLLPLKIINLTRRPRQSVIVREHVPFSVQEIYSDFAIHNLAVSETRTLARSVLANKRGKYELSKITLIGGDSMGIFRVSRNFELAGQIVIFPATVRISQISLDLKNSIRVANNGRPLGVSGQGQEIFGLRDYFPGDPVRIINWKASAKLRHLVVKEFEAHAINKINILLDVRKKDIGDDLIYNNFEYLISTAASLVLYLSGVYCNVAFITGREGGDKIIFESGTAYSIGRRIMDVLADLQPADVELDYLIDANVHVFQPNSVLYCLTLSQTETDRQIFSELIDRGVDVRWIYAPRESFPPIVPGHQASKKCPVTDTLQSATPAPRTVLPGMHIKDAVLT